MNDSGMSNDAVTRQQQLRALPAIDELLRDPMIAALHQRYPHPTVATWVRDAVEYFRREIVHGRLRQPEQMREQIIQRISVQQVQESKRTIQAVINATGIILHTNLGRAPLAPQAVERMVQVAGYTNVELDLHSGKRSQRGEQAERLLQRLTAAEDAIVVNNCAAATVLVLHTLASGREVIVSRGQLVEIGGGFRLPDVFRSAGVILREVGTTNRTYVHDYEAALCDQTGAILRVHPSNFRMSGFVTQPTTLQLMDINRPREVPLIDDLGSGWIRNLPELSLQEPSVVDSVQAGADVTLFSGDKLLGGPQCGIIVGRRKWIGAMRQSPLMRALRVDKLIFAALEATLEIHLSGLAAVDLPVLAMIAASPDQIRNRCAQVVSELGQPPRVRIVPCDSQIGGGSVPETRLASYALQIACEHPNQMGAMLRRGRPAIQSRLQDDSVLLDLRTVADQQCPALVNGLRIVLTQDE